MADQYLLEACLSRLAEAEKLLQSARKAEDIILSVQQALKGQQPTSGSEPASSSAHLPAKVFQVPASPAAANGPPLSPFSAFPDQAVILAMKEELQLARAEGSVRKAAQMFLKKMNSSTRRRREEALKQLEATPEGTESRLLVSEPVQLKRKANLPQPQQIVLTRFQLGKLTWHYPYLVPESKYRFGWDLLSLACVMYTTYSLPVYLAFNVKPTGWWFLVASLVDLFFILDVYVQFTTCTRTPLGTLVTSPRRIALGYARTWFLPDAVSAVPWEWISVQSDLQITRLFRILRLVRLLRLLKMDILNESVKMYIETRPTLVFAQGIIRVLFILLGITHWAACGWYMVGTLPGIEPSWVSVHLEGVTEAWICYAYSLYFTLTTMTTTGYGDITAQNPAEVIFACVLLGVAIVVFASLMGTLIDLIANLNSEKNLQSERVMMLSNYLAWRRVPRDLFMAIRRHMLLQWETNRGYDDYEAEMKDQLPPALRKELANHIYGRVIRGCPFLHFMAPFDAVVRELCSRVRVRYFSRGDTLLVSGRPNEQIFVLLTGTVRLSLNHNLFTLSARVDEPKGPESHEEDEHMDPRFIVPGVTSPRKMGSRVRDLIKRVSSRSPLSPRARSPGISRDSPKSPQSPSSPSNRNCVFTASNLQEAVSQQDLRDHIVKRAACRIQEWWRTSQRARERQLRIRVSHRHIRSHSIDAPVYFGESCLWEPLETWSEAIPHSGYTALCEGRCEVLSFTRSDLHAVLQIYSPWLAERFTDFQKDVAESFREVEQQAQRTASRTRRPGPAHQPAANDLTATAMVHALQALTPRGSTRVDASPRPGPLPRKSSSVPAQLHQSWSSLNEPLLGAGRKAWGHLVRETIAEGH